MSAWQRLLKHFPAYAEVVNQNPPTEFTDALLTLRDATYDSHVKVSEIPSPHGIAPFAAAIRLDCAALDDNSNSGGAGRLVILYDPLEQPGWQGRFRLVTMLHAQVDVDLVTEPLADQVCWSWLTDFLTQSGASFIQSAGSITRSHSASFGELDKRSESAELEIRASWTQLANNLASHGEAISRLLAMMAGHAVELSAGISRLGQVRLV